MSIRKINTDVREIISQPSSKISTCFSPQISDVGRVKNRFLEPPLARKAPYINSTKKKQTTSPLTLLHKSINPSPTSNQQTCLLLNDKETLLLAARRTTLTRSVHTIFRKEYHHPDIHRVSILSRERRARTPASSALSTRRSPTLLAACSRRPLVCLKKHRR